MVLFAATQSKRTDSPDNDSAFCDNISSNSGNGSNGCTESSSSKLGSHTGTKNNFDKIGWYWDKKNNAPDVLFSRINWGLTYF